MRVCHIITDLQAGGAELMLKRLVTDSAADVQHRVISLRTLGTVGPELMAMGVDVRAMGMAGLRTVSAFARLRADLRADRSDLVQTWLYHADVIGGLAARAAGVRSVVWGVRTADTRAGVSLSRGARAMLRASALLSRGVPSRVVYVAHAARTVHEAQGYDPARSVVIHNGFIIPSGEQRAAGRARVRRDLGVHDDQVLIGTAGSFTPQKNQIGFVAACGVLTARYPNAQFVLIGRRNDTDNAELVEAIARTGHPDRFHVLGERRDMPDCLAALDLFCLASRGEGFPNVVGEAMAVATPCVVTDVGDAALLVAHTGTVIPPDSPDALAAALDAQLALGVDERTRQGQAARARIEVEFSLAAARARYLTLYRSLMEQHGRAA